MQLGLVEPLDPGLADRLGTAIFHRVQDLGFLLVDAPDIADGMGEVRAHRIVPHELRLDLQPRQAVLVDRQYGDLLFGQFIEQGDRYEWMPRLLQRLVEQDPVFGGQVQQADHLVQLAFEVGGALTGNGQVETGTVVGQQHAVAVVDQAASRGDGQHVHTIVFGDGRVIVELDHLQEIQAPDQGAGDGDHQQGTGQQSFVDQLRLFSWSLIGIGSGIATASRGIVNAGPCG